ncbi:Rab-GTPase-TBC domain protein [Ceratobasidium sp. AG-Ba]|nr:Rab-GTPase-TBC domain protein [Ceratobasidium sp. AG-Ba]
MALATQSLPHPHRRMPPSSFNTHSDAASIRSSSETTAATIFSMYEEPQFKTGPQPPVPALDPRYRNSRMSVGSRASVDRGSSRPVTETSSRPLTEHSSRPVTDSSSMLDRKSGEAVPYEPTVRQRERVGPPVSYGGPPGSRRSSRQDVFHPHAGQDPHLYPTRQSSLHRFTDSGTSSIPIPQPQIAIQPTATPSLSTHSNPSGDLLTPATDKSRDRRTSAHTQTTQTEYTTRGSTEDADGYRVRATYARLEAEGVPGDGWMEGVERTRTRVVSAASAAVLEASKGAGEKGAAVSEDEEKRLRSTDRYGFFNTPAPRHEGRLALLPSQPFRHLPSTSKQPAIPTPQNAVPPLPSITSIPAPEVDRRELHRIGKWERMLLPSSNPGARGEAWKWDPRKVKKRTERVFKGIPDRWRSAAWGTLTEEKILRRGPRVGLAELASRYRDLVDQPSEHDVQIDLDVPRTISGHVMFHTRYGQGQRSLFHVLHAFSLLCPSCGYVQGMGPIAATLLNYFDPERTYAILVRLHDEYEMHTIFQPGFPGLLESIYVQERLVERTMPGVYQALSKHMISSTSFVTKWYITLFANTVPFQTQLRLWDAFLLEGRDVLVITAVAILWVVKEQISAAQANFETILSLLSSTFVLEDEDQMMRWMERLLSDRRLRDEMAQWRADWGRLVAEGKSGSALL